MAATDSTSSGAAALDLSQFYQVFFEEAAEHLADMESRLLGLDPAHASDDELNAIFRAAHSIKGGSGTFGFTDMTEVTHELESLLDRARKHTLTLTVEMVDALLASGDILKAQLAHHRGQGDAPAADAAACCARIRALLNPGSATAQPAAPVAAAPGAAAVAATLAAAPAVLATARALLVRFAVPRARAARRALDDAIAELGMLGTLSDHGNAGKSARSGRRTLHLVTAASTDEIRNVLGFAIAPDKIDIEAADAAGSAALPTAVGTSSAPTAATTSGGIEGFGLFDDAPGTPATGTALAATAEAGPGYGFFEPLPANPATAALTDAAPAQAAVTLEPAPERRTSHEGRRATDHEVAPAPGRRESDRATSTAAAEMTSIRVGVEKVDQLINLVGELVITQAMLTQTATRADDGAAEALNTSLTHLERNTRDLQEAVMSIRMMPISFVFSRFPRVVRDLAAKLGKQVTLKTIGEGTEIDKGLIEKLADPLTHLVRNSLDHAIELPDVREAAGKPATGTITLQAYHQGGNIIVEVADDGAGLNRARILDKARERGLPVHERMSDAEVWQLIFEAGFSTAAVVTDVSGRGVGMDVVKRNIHALGGRVDIASVEGRGTTITIRLPLTLAILDGMSIGVGDEIYIFPLTCIIESLQPSEAAIRSVAGQGQVIEVRGEYLPIVSLHEFFGIGAARTRMSEGILVIIEANHQKTAVFVDRLIGQHQVVIKSLETNFRRVRGISGATIMGDGRVAMIIDAAALANTAARRNTRALGDVTH